MFEQECVPFAPTLIESMRSLGYSFSSAIADLIDNSISAGANCIDIISEPGINPTLIILDNGCGMDGKELYEAMRYGSSNPLEERSKDDLGRFGLGMKSASLSQCRKLVVVTKKNNEMSACSWDLDYVIQKKAWMLKVFSDSELEEFPYIDRLKDMEHGTYVYLSEFDRIEEAKGNLAQAFNKCLDEMNDHLALVFHRFLENELIIKINELEIEGRDPFLSYHPATQKKKESNVYIDDEKITLKPFILPHLSKLSKEDLIKVGGKENLRNDQGFYVYRNRRLIIWGTWFRIERKDELNKLARVRVDIPNSLDYMWSIDIKKSTAVLPDKIKKNMYSAVYDSVLSSEHVHTYRGRKEKKNDEIDYIWERIKKRDSYKYVINRDIPQFKLLEETLDDDQIKMFNKVIEVIEESFPVAALYVDAAKGDVDSKSDKEHNEEVEEVWENLLIQIEYIKTHHLPVLEYYKAFQKTEPFCNYKEIIDRIQKEIDKYE